jgi:hypothetical protein
MQSPADNCGSGLDGHRRAAPAVPFDKDETAPPQQRGKLDENLFSEDARRQYAALKELESSTAITKARYDRIHDIRWTTRHLALAELAERILKEKRPAGPISADVHQEILSLIRQCERQQRQRLLKSLQEDPVIAFCRRAMTRWLVSAALAGFVLGGGLTYLLVSKGGPPDARAVEAYLDTRTGNVISADSPSEKHQAGGVGRGDCRPAFYCWNCRQWLPVKRPQKPGASADVPMQALLNRPIASQVSGKVEPRR